MPQVPEYSLYQDRGFYADFKNLNEATDCAEVLLGGCEEPTTFTIENEDRYIIASLTNRRIIGEFVKQVLIGRKKDYEEEIERVEFDATDHILLMNYDQLIELTDNSVKSDDIGTSHVSWNGPYCVHITDSICEYFDVNEVRNITPEQFAFARQLANPQPLIDFTIPITVNVKLRAAPGCDLDDAVRKLHFNLESTIPGVVVSEVIIGNPFPPQTPLSSCNSEQAYP